MTEFRAAEPRDAPALVELLAQLGYPTDEHSVRQRLETLLARSDIVVLIAEEHGHVLGVGTLHLLPVLHEDAPRGQITALVVAESARGRGV
ncbi:MAG: GNAT family N-acetyltransferase, partial [Chloroflexota bacterium]|nr:GNAT family N-acetyltransferase [Chloroflexota bacterium]